MHTGLGNAAFTQVTVVPFKAYKQSGRGRRGQPCRTSAGTVATARLREEPKESTPLDILVSDCRYLQEHTGVDLITTLAPVRDVHDKVVAVLNPLAKEKLTEDLQDEILQLQTVLQQAHEEVHVLEKQLEDTIGYLSGLERSAVSLQSALDEASTTQQMDVEAGDAQQEREQSSSAATTSQAFVSQRRSPLHSGLDIPDTLKEFWYPVEFASKLRMGKSRSISLFNEPWRLMRTAAGDAICLPDLATKRPAGASREQTALKVIEKDGFIFVWTGDAEPTTLPEDSTLPPEGFTIHSELELEVPVEHGLLLENLLDLAHAPFTHTSTFAKGWPIPDVVRFNAAKLLGGNWEPYPIDMSFEPPCMVLSTIGLAQPGKIERGLRAEACKKHLHQLHVCLPAGHGRTRLLYRMSMDFMSWTKFVPLIERFWAGIANQVLSEDLVLVKGQQERMLAGANVWANPVSYDKLGVRYRRWRNSLASGTKAEQQAAREELVPMAAGELFSLEESL